MGPKLSTNAIKYMVKEEKIKIFLPSEGSIQDPVMNPSIDKSMTNNPI